MDSEPPFAPPPLKAKRKSATKVAIYVGWGLKANGLKHVKHATSKRIICCKKVLHSHTLGWNQMAITHTHTHTETENEWQGKPNKLLCNCKPLCCSFARPTHRKLIQTPATKGRKKPCVRAENMQTSNAKK